MTDDELYAGLIEMHGRGPFNDKELADFVQSVRRFDAVNAAEAFALEDAKFKLRTSVAYSKGFRAGYETRRAESKGSHPDGVQAVLEGYGAERQKSAHTLPPSLSGIPRVGRRNK